MTAQNRGRPDASHVTRYNGGGRSAQSFVVPGYLLSIPHNRLLSWERAPTLPLTPTAVGHPAGPHDGQVGPGEAVVQPCCLRLP